GCATTDGAFDHGVVGSGPIGDLVVHLIPLFLCGGLPVPGRPDLLSKSGARGGHGIGKGNEMNDKITNWTRSDDAMV
ncbi:hypothetical protein AB9F35_37315, partial [Rhizobium leguminosarum]|uniref:hypothetical protein n=1 Tax=Rhizobium leguminosarum TaxID=384 RepID=UPI003F9AE11F